MWARERRDKRMEMVQRRSLQLGTIPQDRLCEERKAALLAQPGKLARCIPRHYLTRAATDHFYRTDRRRVRQQLYMRCRYYNENRRSES